MEHAYYIDTHFHIFLKDFRLCFSKDVLIKKSIDAGVKKMWLASTNKKDNVQNLNLCKKYPKNLKSWVGFHPEEIWDYNKDFLIDLLNDKQKKESIVGVGEIGLDLDEQVLKFLKNKGFNSSSILSRQQQIFREQIIIAKKYNFPFAVHSRNAFEPTLEVLQEFPKSKFIWHCFNSDLKSTKKLLKSFKNIYFGVNAIITYKSGQYILNSLQEIPLSRLFVETDAPFLSPRPFKYPHNTPEGVIPVYNYLSKEFSLDLKSLKKQIIKNMLTFLNINHVN